MNSIQIFVTCTDSWTEQTVCQLAQKLPPAQMVKFHSLTRMKRKKEFLAGRLLLVEMLKRECPQNPCPNIIERDKGGPMLNRNNALHHSISHSNGVVCCALGSSVLGLDIEYLKDKLNLVEASNVFMEKAEFDFFQKLSNQNDRKQYFYDSWCLKEAIFKALNLDEQKRFTFSLFHSHDYIKENQWFVYQAHIHQCNLVLVYSCSVVDIELRHIDLDNDM